MQLRHHACGHAPRNAGRLTPLRSQTSGITSLSYCISRRVAEDPCQSARRRSRGRGDQDGGRLRVIASGDRYDLGNMGKAPREGAGAIMGVCDRDDDDDGSKVRGRKPG